MKEYNIGEVIGGGQWDGRGSGMEKEVNKNYVYLNKEFGFYFIGVIEEMIENKLYDQICVLEGYFGNLQECILEEKQDQIQIIIEIYVINIIYCIWVYFIVNFF